MRQAAFVYGDRNFRVHKIRMRGHIAYCIEATRWPIDRGIEMWEYL